MNRETHFVVCVRNDGHEESLEVRKIYARIEDAAAEARGLVRVVDEDEDYLYPAAWFLPIVLPHELEEAIAKLA
jgi:hypothetical protein